MGLEHQELPRLLLVDDNRQFVRACAQAWNSRCIVMAAYSGRHALAIAAKTSEIDLALVDQHLDDYLGLCLITELKAVRDVHAVLISATMTYTLAHSAWIADDVQGKPVEIDRVLARFRSPLRARGPGRH